MLTDIVKNNFFLCVCFYLETKGVKLSSNSCCEHTSFTFDNSFTFINWNFNFEQPSETFLNSLTIEDITKYRLLRMVRNDKTLQAVIYAINSRLPNTINKVSDEEMALFYYNNHRDITNDPFH